MSDFVKNREKLIDLAKTRNFSNKMPRRRVFTIQFAAKSSKKCLIFLKTIKK